MDDLIPFLIFVGVALINLIKTAIERSGAKSAPRPAPRKATPSTQESPTTLEEFFETISDQFGIEEEEAAEEEDFFETQEPSILKETTVIIGATLKTPIACQIIQCFLQHNPYCM